MTRFKIQQWVVNPVTGQKEYFTASNIYLLNNKISKKNLIWKEQLIKKEEKFSKDLTKLKCEELNNKLKQINFEFDNILLSTLDKNDIVNWDMLKDSSKFLNEKPEIENFYKPRKYKKILGFITLNKKKIDAKNKDLLLNAEAELKHAILNWQTEKNEFEEKIRLQHLSIENLKFKYENGEKEGVEYYHEVVFDQSIYPEGIQLNYNLNYKNDSKLILVDIQIPNKLEINQIGSYKYISMGNIIQEIKLKEKQINDCYNAFIHKIILRTIHETCESDYKNNIDLIIVNGWVSGIDFSTGKDFKNCIASIQVKKSDFLEIILDKVDAIQCFKKLKGVSAGYLADLVAINPIMKIDTEDKRVVEANKVIDNYTNNQNLALMPWEDFEILIRDLFFKMFGSDTCKVEVTQASRDAGVDAIVFDLDPIKGGKYVIQAKRYNNIVPVSAVRDLYGTIMNEGAVKGILVTTSYFGADSYEFAKNKPITLISGSELIGIFNKFNYNVRINLKEKII
jgi:restriction system protein